ncbi:alpha/beta hydrolase [Pedobacter sp.]|uniref:alpha/beta hydrolase n=1 Tax=Pedobacter sp. TaxID=1411316 RepID=UPI003D7F62CF
MTKLNLTLILLAIFTGPLVAQEVIPLYEGAIPGAKPVPANYKELWVTGDDGVIRVSKVSLPTITAYLPEKGKATGTAVLICPGGGYGILAINHEGDKVAKEFTNIGVAAFVLKYRLPDDQIMEDKSTGPLQDAQQAMSLLQKNAKRWGINPDKIGVMGFSAGGHLASTLSVRYNAPKISDQTANIRPAFSLLIYPVISLSAFPHLGTSNNLLGKEASDVQKVYFSNDKHINKQTPPAFIVHAADDGGVAVQNSILYAQGLVEHQVPVELHVYQSGGHGFGLNNKTTTDQWFERLRNWMQMNKLL